MATTATELTRAESRAAWLEERRSGLGGSDIASVLGIHGSAFAVWASKVLPTEAEIGLPNNRVRWGKRLERAVAEEYAEITGQAIEWMGERVLRHPAHAWWIGSPDAGVLAPDGAPSRYAKGLEIKTTGNEQRAHWGEIGTDQIPERFIVQVCHYAPLLAVESFDVYVLIGGNDDRVYTVRRDRELEAVMAEEGERFWREYVIPRKQPPLDASDAATQYVRAKFPRVVEDIRDATADEAALLLEYQQARTEFAAAEERKDAIENRVREAIGDRRGLVIGGAQVTLTEVAPARRTDWQAVAAECGIPTDVIARHTTEHPSARRLNWPRRGI